MKARDEITKLLLLYPLVTPNKGTALLDLFFRHYGYSWINGEISFPENTSKVPTIAEAVKCAISDVFVENLNTRSLAHICTDPVQIGFRNAEDGVKWYVGNSIVDLNERLDLIFNLDKRLADTQIPRTTIKDYDEVTKTWKTIKEFDYCVDSKSLIYNLPDDIQPDWLEAAEEAYNSYMSLPLEGSRGFNWERTMMSKVKHRINKLKTKKQESSAL